MTTTAALTVAANWHTMEGLTEIHPATREVYAALGAAFALLYRHCGTLWAPIATHATNNLLACGMMIWGYGG